MAKPKRAVPTLERKVVVNGEDYVVGGAITGQIRKNMLARETRNRNAWRVICLDGGDVILRNMRSPDSFEAVSEDEFRTYYRTLKPAK